MKAETKFIRQIQKLSEDEEFHKRHIRNTEKDVTIQSPKQTDLEIMKVKPEKQLSQL